MCQGADTGSVSCWGRCPALRLQHSVAVSLGRLRWQMRTVTLPGSGGVYPRCGLLPGTAVLPDPVGKRGPRPPQLGRPGSCFSAPTTSVPLATPGLFLCGVALISPVTMQIWVAGVPWKELASPSLLDSQSWRRLRNPGKVHLPRRHPGGRQHRVPAQL